MGALSNNQCPQQSPRREIESWAARSMLFGSGGVHASICSLSRDVLPHRPICLVMTLALCLPTDAQLLREYTQPNTRPTTRFFLLRPTRPDDSPISLWTS